MILTRVTGKKEKDKEKESKYIYIFNQRYIWSNGEMYIGDWDQDYMEGEGMLYL